MCKTEVPVWRALRLRRLGWGFGSFHDYDLREKHGIRTYGALGNFTDKGTIPSRGEVSLARMSKEDLGIGANQSYSYRDLLDLGTERGLKPVLPGIGFQLYAAGLEEDFLFDGWFMSDPKHVPDTGTKGCIAPLVISRTTKGLFLTSESLLHPDEPIHKGGRDLFFIFEC